LTIFVLYDEISGGKVKTTLGLLRVTVERGNCMIATKRMQQRENAIDRRGEEEFM
jgi:hypothetical protein